jgi:uncharacterized protein YcbK (DUF882 family)
VRVVGGRRVVYVGGRVGRSRREILGLGARAALGLWLMPRLGRAAVPSDRALSFHCLHTGEALTVEYCAGGCYLPDGLGAIDRLLRDHRTGDVTRIDPALLDVLFTLHRRVASRAPFQVISGYRSPATNAMLRRTGHDVAEHSFHTRGQAVDVYLPDRALRQLGRAALGLGAGGVGYYPRPGFVHLDTGPVRRWGG